MAGRKRARVDYTRLMGGGGGSEDLYSEDDDGAKCAAPQTRCSSPRLRAVPE
jgi:hypothetical protein